MARRRREIGKAGWGRSAITLVISFIYFFPVLWIILTAFKTHTDALAIPPKFIFSPTLENFANAIHGIEPTIQPIDVAWQHRVYLPVDLSLQRPLEHSAQRRQPQSCGPVGEQRSPSRGRDVPLNQ